MGGGGTYHIYIYDKAPEAPPTVTVLGHILHLHLSALYHRRLLGGEAVEDRGHWEKKKKKKMLQLI